MSLTAARLREILDYDPKTGVFVWKISIRRMRAGDVAGCLTKNGYVVIRIEQRNYLAQRLAHLYMTGEWPPAGMDHRDLVRSNNRWANLRPADQAQNMWNFGPKASNTSGFKGVWLDKRRGKWVAETTVRQKKVHLGSFATPEAAASAYAAAAARLHGEFARLN